MIIEKRIIEKYLVEGNVLLIEKSSILIEWSFVLVERNCIRRFLIGDFRFSSEGHGPDDAQVQLGSFVLKVNRNKLEITLNYLELTYSNNLKTYRTKTNLRSSNPN
jgi:hypothetical protein